ncbi:hypothetical protein ABMA28_006437 [Loxostege sticticalis]|uniref:RNA-directed DNA polymerase n=1 Tax=Loxostege sticticalis TaxID=481309 RepID=A0ABD0SL82_LOXSC
MAATKFSEFDVVNGDFSSYCDRLDMYFVANNISDDKKLPTLISIIGEAGYELMVNLCSPEKPHKKNYSDIVELMCNHLQPKPSILAARYHFRQRRQQVEETVTQYMSELKRLSRACEFKANLEENLRDQFVCGLRSDVIRQRLFSESDLSWTNAIKIATNIESAARDASVVELSLFGEGSRGIDTANLPGYRSTRASGIFAARRQSGAGDHVDVNRLTSRTDPRSTGGCTACGDNTHVWRDCRYRTFECSRCRRVGHLRRMCRMGAGAKTSWQNPGGMAGVTPDNRARGATSSGARGGGSAARNARGRGRGAGAGLRTHYAQEEVYSVEEEDQQEQDQEEEPVYLMSLGNYKPVSVSIKVCDRLIKMEIDTGSALSCISESTYLQMFSELPLQTCNLSLRFYDGSRIKPLGVLEVNVKYGKICKHLELYVIENGTTNLLGRQWLTELEISVPKFTQNPTETCNKLECDIDKLKQDLSSRFKDVFDTGLGKFSGGRARLRIRPNATPIFCRARPLPYALRERVDAELDAMLRAGVIEPVDHSDWATPLVIVHKPDASLRLCADYKVTLNRALLVDKFPVPKVEDLFSKISGSKYFTKLDLSQAYNQILLEDASTEYTVINTHRGLFKYKRLVYGLSSSPGIFQRLMNDMLKNIPNVNYFLDDILISTTTITENIKTLELVLETLSKNGLKIKREKCNFLSTEVKYLGFIIDESGIRVDPNKVKPILNMVPPNNVSELRSFIGMVNFYGKFIKNLSEHLAPLYTLLKKNVRYFWSYRQNNAFNKIKTLLGSTEVLAYYDVSKPVVLTCDAGPRGLGAVLAQRDAAGRERVIAYASRALTSPELSYSQIHKEALAIIFSVKKFHQYLYGRHFTLRTDHKPLVSIFGPDLGIPTMTANRLQRWALILSAYDFSIEYIKSDDNTADALSRLISAQKAGAGKEEECPEQTYLHFASEALLLDYQIIRKETLNDTILSRVFSYIRDGWPVEMDIRELRPYFNRKTELYCEMGCIMWGHRVVIPEKCRDKVLRELHDTHMGVVKTKALARSYAWWPGIDEAVEAQCRACDVCAAQAPAPPHHRPCSWPWPSRPWSRLHLDFLGPIAGNKYFVIVDSSSKWIEIFKMPYTTAQMVINKLREVFARFGLPKQIVSDNGPPFSSEELSSFCQNNGIDHIFTAPYHPSSNGAAENAVKLCKRVIKKALIQKVEVELALNRFLLIYRNTVHNTTGDSPSQLLLGRMVRTRLDCLKPDREKRIINLQRRQENAAGGNERIFTNGDNVWFRIFGGKNKWEKGLVTGRLGDTDYIVKGIHGGEVHRHVDQLKRREIGQTIESKGMYAYNSHTDGIPLSAAFAAGRGGAGESSASPLAKNADATRDRCGESPARAADLRPTTVSACAPPLAGDRGSMPGPTVMRNLDRVRRKPVRYGFEEID